MSASASNQVLFCEGPDTLNRHFKQLYGENFEWMILPRTKSRRARIPASYRCLDCGGGPRCNACILDAHNQEPFHRIQVRSHQKRTREKI